MISLSCHATHSGTQAWLHTPEVTIQILWLVGLSPKWSIPRISEPISLPSPPLCSNLSNYIWHVTSIISFIFQHPPTPTQLLSFSYLTTLTETHAHRVLRTLMLLSVSAGNVSHAAFDKNNFLHHWSHSTSVPLFLQVRFHENVVSGRFIVEFWNKCKEESVCYKGRKRITAMHPTGMKWIAREETRRGARRKGSTILPHIVYEQIPYR